MVRDRGRLRGWGDTSANYDSSGRDKCPMKRWNTMSMIRSISLVVLPALAVVALFEFVQPTALALSQVEEAAQPQTSDSAKQSARRRGEHEQNFKHEDPANKKQRLPSSA